MDTISNPQPTANYASSSGVGLQGTSLTSKLIEFQL